MDTHDFAAGGYRYLPAVFQYSSGVAALPGFEILRVQLKNPIPLSRGFAEIERTIRKAERPLTSFCACELRSPVPFTDEGFRAFNENYVVTLRKWGLLEGDRNPVARSNVCPEIEPPSETLLHAFCFTVTVSETAGTFVISGSGEATEGGGSYRERTIRYGEISEVAMREKARFVLGEMERRLALLGFSWADVSATQVYTVHDLYPFFADEIIRRGAARAGLIWHLNRPPVRGLEFEMDCRGIGRERVILSPV
jgi:hypothetical protein